MWLVQRGSPESKQVEERGRESDEDQQVGRFAGPDFPAWARATGWRRAVFSRSLGSADGSVLPALRGASLVAGASAGNTERLQHLRAPSP